MSQVSPFSVPYKCVSCNPGARGGWGTYQFVKNASIELPFLCSTMPHLLIMIVQALPMRTELLQAILVDVVDPSTSRHQLWSRSPIVTNPLPFPHGLAIFYPEAVYEQAYLHAGCTSCRLSALPHAIYLTLPVGICLALHVIIVEGSTSRTDKKSSAEKGSRASADLFDLGDGVRKGCCVNEDLLVEPLTGISRKFEGLLELLYLGCRAAIAMVVVTHAQVKGSLIVYVPLVELRCGGRTLSAVIGCVS